MSRRPTKRQREVERLARIRKAGKPRAPTAVRSCEEVADIMTSRGYRMSKSRVAQIEHRALAKLRELLVGLAADFAPDRACDPDYATQRQVDDARRDIINRLNLKDEHERSLCG